MKLSARSTYLKVPLQSQTPRCQPGKRDQWISKITIASNPTLGPAQGRATAGIVEWAGSEQQPACLVRRWSFSKVCHPSQLRRLRISDQQYHNFTAALLLALNSPDQELPFFVDLERCSTSRLPVNCPSALSSLLDLRRAKESRTFHFNLSQLFQLEDLSKHEERMALYVDPPSFHLEHESIVAELVHVRQLPIPIHLHSLTRASISPEVEGSCQNLQHSSVPRVSSASLHHHQYTLLVPSPPSSLSRITLFTPPNQCRRRPIALLPTWADVELKQGGGRRSSSSGHGFDNESGSVQLDHTETRGPTPALGV